MHPKPHSSRFGLSRDPLGVRDEHGPVDDGCWGSEFGQLFALERSDQVLFQRQPEERARGEGGGV